MTTLLSIVAIPHPTGSAAPLDPIVRLAWLVVGAALGLLLSRAIPRYRMLRHPLVRTMLALRVGTLMLFAKTDRAMGVPWPARVWTRIVLAALRAQLRIAQMTVPW